MENWIEFKLLKGDTIVDYCVEPYKISSFQYYSKYTTVINLEDEDGKFIIVAEPYEDVKRKVCEATEPKYQVQITEPKEEQ